MLVDAFEHVTETTFTAEPARVRSWAAGAAGHAYFAADENLVLHAVSCLSWPMILPANLNCTFEQSVFKDQLPAGNTLLHDLVQLKSQPLWAVDNTFGHDKFGQQTLGV